MPTEDENSLFVGTVRGLWQTDSLTILPNDDPHLAIGRAVDKVLADLQAGYGRLPETVLCHALATGSVSAIENKANIRAEHWLRQQRPKDIDELAGRLASAARDSAVEERRDPGRCRDNGDYRGISGSASVRVHADRVRISSVIGAADLGSALRRLARTVKDT